MEILLENVAMEMKEMPYYSKLSAEETIDIERNNEE